VANGLRGGQVDQFVEEELLQHFKALIEFVKKAEVQYKQV
jgi:hypothetical protein